MAPAWPSVKVCVWGLVVASKSEEKKEKISGDGVRNVNKSFPIQLFLRSEYLRVKKVLASTHSKKNTSKWSKICFVRKKITSHIFEISGTLIVKNHWMRLTLSVVFLLILTAYLNMHT